MLPLIVIGATDQIRAVLADVDQVSYHDTAEQAHRELSFVAQIEQDPDRGWHVNVAYGPNAFGALSAARVGSVASPRLAHTGQTLVLGYHVHGEPGQARQVIDGMVDDSPEDRSFWQAGVAVHADLLLDVATPSGLQVLRRFLAWKAPQEA